MDAKLKTAFETHERNKKAKEERNETLKSRGKNEFRNGIFLAGSTIKESTSRAKHPGNKSDVFGSLSFKSSKPERLDLAAIRKKHGLLQH